MRLNCSAACAMVSAYIFETGHDTYGLEWVGESMSDLAGFAASPL